MNEKKMAVVDVLTQAMAETAKRAIEAERQRDEAKLKELEWYQNYRSKDKELQDAKGRLAAEIENHTETQKALKKALDRIEGMTELAEVLGRAEETEGEEQDGEL